jgi:hypothetical protein
MGKQVQVVLLITYLPLLLAYVADGILGPRAGSPDWVRSCSQLRFFGEFALAMLALHVTLTMFVNLKQYVPALNVRLWDSNLWRLDEQLHFGIAIAPAVHEWSAELGVLPLLDRAYLLYYPAQVLVPLLFLLSARLRPDRGRFFLAFCVVWMVGSAIYIALPALGPCYYRRVAFPGSIWRRTRSTSRAC